MQKLCFFGANLRGAPLTDFFGGARCSIYAPFRLFFSLGVPFDRFLINFWPIFARSCEILRWFLEFLGRFFDFRGNFLDFSASPLVFWAWATVDFIKILLKISKYLLTFDIYICYTLFNSYGPWDFFGLFWAILRFLSSFARFLAVLSDFGAFRQPLSVDKPLIKRTIMNKWLHKY